MHALGSSKETERVTQRFMREIVTWKRVSQHENIADLLGIYRTDHDPPYLVLPYYGNNKLLAYLAQSHPDMRLILAKEIARGVDVLHGNGVIHGDLKPENIFVSDDGHAKIADFGVSVIPQLAGFTTTSMNPKNVRYSAPELLPLTDINPPMPTRQSDIFSLGILFMQLFDGRVDCLPYNHVPKNVNDGGDTNLLKRIHKPKSDRPRREDHPNISKSRWNVIAACWAADPSARPSIRRVRAWLGQV
ncbi:kinase-like protein [Athelia psychrophila]|uniref:Kinase-like protein n=1 Tax=Athelia psychrophila TaxID=1759441 RepID=A0A166GV87_9AGAM|nr:kinase-like protein [Fibularhizoctonia sp. CBS 109695]